MEEVYVEEFMSPGCVGCPAVKEMLEGAVGKAEGVIVSAVSVRAQVEVD